MPRAVRKFYLFVCITGVVLFPAPTPAQQPSPAPPSAPAGNSDPNAWVQFGISNGMKGDMDMAISNFDQALKIDPNYAPAYQSRGHALLLEGKLDSAMADFNKAIEINPKFDDAYYDRGVVRGEEGDFPDALADFNKTLELNPKNGAAFYNRGHVKYFTGDLDGVIPDLNQAIALNPNGSLSYFIRGLARLAKFDREGSAADFQQSAVNGYPDGAFWLWIVKMENGQRGVARSGLSDSVNKPLLFKPDEWPSQIGNFLLEKTTQDQLIAKAQEGTPDPTRLCEAWFYSGMVLRFSGDIKGALGCFQKALATNAKGSEMYIEAQRETTDLQKIQ